MQNVNKSAFDLDQNVAAGLAYVPVLFCHLIVSIAILATDKTNKLPRFHAFQSLLITAMIFIGAIITVVLIFIILMLAAILNAPALGILSFLIYGVFILFVMGMIVCLVISCIKAFQGQIFKLPIIGSMADKWSN